MQGALDGNGTFTGITEVNTGSTDIGTPNVGFIMQLGGDKGFSVTLNGSNSYTGGTSILAGTLIIVGDSSLGAVPTKSNSAFYASLAFNPAGFPDNVTAAVQADNGIIFNSLSEGNGTLTIGTSSGNGTSTFSTSRPIAVGGEVANLNLNGYLVTLSGPIISLGQNSVGTGNQSGKSDLTIEDSVVERQWRADPAVDRQQPVFLRQLDHQQRHAAGVERRVVRQYDRRRRHDRSDRAQRRHASGRREFQLCALSFGPEQEHFRYRQVLQQASPERSRTISVI